MSLVGKTVLVTGAGRRIGKQLALTLAKAGADIIIQYSQSHQEAEQTAAEIKKLGRKAEIFSVDFRDEGNIIRFVDEILINRDIYGLVNNSSIFEPYGFADTTTKIWHEHININLTAPFLLSQYFVLAKNKGQKGRIVNILDWRSERPGADHFAYTISKSALAALTLSTAQALAPDINVNGLALGAILPPSDGESLEKILQNVPAQRWGNLDEVCQALLFLMDGPEYITGEIIHIDGGRHLT